MTLHEAIYFFQMLLVGYTLYQLYIALTLITDLSSTDQMSKLRNLNIMTVIACVYLVLTAILVPVIFILTDTKTAHLICLVIYTSNYVTIVVIYFYVMAKLRKEITKLSANSEQEFHQELQNLNR